MLVGRSVARPRLHPDARSGRLLRLGDRARGGQTAARAPAPVRPTVSVVIPVRDDAGHLRACLRALAGQTVAPDEVVVVDNASRDDSADVARGAGARVVHEPVQGIPAAASAGYDAARSEVIARLDADCVPPADWIERLGDVLAARPDVAAVTGAARFVDGPRALRGIAAVAYLGAYFASVTLALGHPPLFGSNFALRRDAWLAVRDEVHREGTHLHDDIDLSVHLGPERRIVLDPHLGMGISMRPLTRPSTLPLRMSRGMASLTVHWPHELPWLRWWRTGRRMIHERGARRTAVPGRERAVGTGSVPTGSLPVSSPEAARRPGPAR
ncbi:cellulose synthase/poly-beta-1,6-N-acetylglucosamine synthase-like glycosyltransferase [Clavibacter michiganensis]|uniref:glycosyltransferase family 2 protein n=1 Tax=Clavibacter michiganensis TaxID=28447 RepID=UPI00195ACDC7|nr:glycosyltransferase family 2 protein [Clavibacter michiganensis]MBM7410521.1 cellulose synthase/poly-beta-1,6-N-acetylglucosamine synthase-like glycosyltransferase [Clavibacter michiganensis]